MKMSYLIYTARARLSTNIIETSRNILSLQKHYRSYFEVCRYKSKSAKVDIHKPKAPTGPFAAFFVEMRPVLLKDHPELLSPEILSICSTLWKQLDVEAKSRFSKEYKEKIDAYNREMELYKSSLSLDEIVDITVRKNSSAIKREKFKVQLEYKETGRPKAPVNPLLLFRDSRKDKMKYSKVYCDKLKSDWLSVPQSERDKFKRLYQELRYKYKQDLSAWKDKMISEGRLDLVIKCGKKIKTVTVAEEQPKISSDKVDRCSDGLKNKRKDNLPHTAQCQIEKNVNHRDLDSTECKVVPNDTKSKSVLGKIMNYFQF